MPPQGVGLLAALGWNWHRSRRGKRTISMLGREHPIAAALVLVGFNAWIWPHLYLKDG